MEYCKDMKKISGDSVVVNELTQHYPTVCKTVGGATYVARMHFDKTSKINIDERLLRLMSEEIEKLNT